MLLTAYLNPRVQRSPKKKEKRIEVHYSCSLGIMGQAAALGRVYVHNHSATRAVYLTTLNFETSKLYELDKLFLNLECNNSKTVPLLTSHDAIFFLISHRIIC
jgi:hypothetical protein